MKLAADDVRASNAILFGIPFTTLNMRQVCDLMLEEIPEGMGVRAVVTANVDHIVRLTNDSNLRSAYSNAWLRTVDGIPVFAYSRCLSLGISHLPGADIVPQLLERLTPGVHRPFFVVANDSLGLMLIEWLQARGFSRNEVSFCSPPFGFEGLPVEQSKLAARVREHKPTHLFMGIGCPRSEIWLDRFREELGDLYALSVGAALAFHVGAMRRAPTPFRAVGMEWLWRMFSEPRRMAKRYLVQSWPFFEVVLKDIYSRIFGRYGYNIGISIN